uniref:DUF659 domain-containing protein n=1 Tax=Romanomermis culicivorax TaxID=13658 RepID=A0A915KL55_ROMCU
MQTKLEPHSRPCEPKRSAKLKSLIADLVIRDLRPLSFTDGSAFKALMDAVEPNLKNYGRKAISNLIKSQYNEKVVEIREKLKSCDPCSISITVDGWVSQSNDAYLTITAHFIDKKWNLVDLNLATCGFEDRHTGENIKEAIKEITVVIYQHGLSTEH